MVDYQKNIVSKITNHINEYGIPNIVNDWKPYVMCDSYKNKTDFYNALTKYVNSYHKHSSILIGSNQTLADKRPPDFSFESGIGIITYYNYYLDTYDKYEKCIEYNTLVDSVRLNLRKWEKRDMDGLIIDLRNHTGGWFYPFVNSLSDILYKTSLFAWSNKKVENKDNKWINLVKDNIKHNSKYKNNIYLPYPIAILIGKNTISSGELCASIFCRNEKNIKLFGEPSGGKLSINEPYVVDDDISLNLTVSYVTTVDGTFHEKEEIIPDVYTDKPIETAIKWILDNALI
jgi:C-terminal processing protease CtpA/Prc